MKHIVSFSGGRTSAYMVYLMEQKRIKDGWDVEYVFMDTGAEHPETYKFIKKVVENFNINLTCLTTVVNYNERVSCGYKIVKLHECKPDLKPFKDIVKKYGVPKNHMPHCTLHMKTSPFKKYCIEKFGKGNYKTWLGIRVDEPRRLSEKQGISYMAEISDFDSDDVLKWWGDQLFDLGFDINSGWLGNCVFCHKKSNSKLALAAMDEPEMLNQFKEMIYSDDSRQLGYTPKDQLYRSGRTIDDIIKMFPQPKDEIVNRLRHSKRFDPSPCSESCEVDFSQIDMFEENKIK
jgi:hypothetical protein